MPRPAAAAALVLACAALAGAGCRNGGAGGASGPDIDGAPASVQIVNGVADAQTLTAAVNGKPLAAPVAYGASSGFFAAPTGEYELTTSVVPLSGGSPVALPSSDTAVAPGRAYTAVAYGQVGASDEPAQIALVSVPKLTGSDRREAERASDKATVRVFNGAVGTGAVDLLANGITAFTGVGYGRSSAPVALAALPYEFTVKPADSGDATLGEPMTLQFKRGHSYLIVVSGSETSGDLQVKAFEE